MIIELITDGSPDCPLIRIFGTNRRDFIRIREVFRFLGEHSNRELSLVSEDGFTTVNISDLRVGNYHDRGVTRQGTLYQLDLSQDNWHLLSMLAEGLLGLPDEVEGYQWLVGPLAHESLHLGEIAVVLSKSSAGFW